MNFYKHHIGDYAQATAHLSFVEDAAYSRMIRKYYAEERPLPADVKAVQRLVGARTREEKQAVADVLEEFFELREDGWHNKRCDFELAENHSLDEDREARAANERERQRRHREERRKLFEQLRAFDIVPAWDTRTETLRKMLPDASATPPVTPPVTLPDAFASRPVTPPVTRTATANQTPDTRHQIPETQEPIARTSEDLASARDGNALSPGEACKAMRAAGLSETNPGHPKLLALLAAGITLDELTDAARTAAEQSKPFAYALATAEGRRRDAAKVTPLPQRTAAAGSRHHGISTTDFREGVSDDGRF